MSAESARDALRERVVEAVVLVLLATFPDSEYELDAVAGDIVEALPAVAPELLAVLAEPQECETCAKDRERAVAMGQEIPNISTASAEAVSEVLVATFDALGCPDCVDGKVAVDVLDLLVQAGLARRFGSQWTCSPACWRDGNHTGDCKGVDLFVAAKDGTP